VSIPRRALTFALSLAACGGSGGASGSADETSASSTASSSAGTGGDATGDTSSAATVSSDSLDTSTSVEPSTGADTDGPGACDPTATFEDGKSPTSEIHVAEGGADAGGCGAAGSPCATIDYAATLATPGTAIRIHAGTYGADAFIDNLAGSEDAPIWLGGAPGEARPVIEGGGEALHISTARYLVVHDLEIRGASGNGINCDDGGAVDDPEAARFVVFRDLFIHDIGGDGNQDCLKLSGLNDYWVLDSEFAACGGGASGSAIDHVGCHRGLIARNLFRDLQGSGNAVQCKGGSEDIEIRGNVMRDPGERAINMGGSTGFEFFRPPLSDAQSNAEATNIRAIANSIQGGVVPFAFVGCVGCLVANNTIVDPENWILRILQETVSAPPYVFSPAQNGHVANNVFYFSRSGISTYVNIGADTMPESFAFTTNLWYAHDDPSQSDPAADLPNPENGGVYGMDPLLVDVAAGDVHLQGGSPAASAGTPLVDLTGDLDGDCWGDPPSIGAQEIR
jgi:hypothetical protein